MNQRVVLVLMACNGTNADSIIAPGSIDLCHYGAVEVLVQSLYLTAAGVIISCPHYWTVCNEEHNHQAFRFNEKSHLLKCTDGPRRQAAV